MKIPLMNGGFSEIDEADYERVRPWIECKRNRWRRWDDKRFPGRSSYAGRYVKRDGKQAIEFLHRVISNAQPGQHVDHINSDGLDNRRANLRLGTHSQNRANSRPWKKNPTGFRGVYQQGKFFMSSITNGSHSVRYLGRFPTAREAALAYNAAALGRWGEFARLNAVE